MYSRYMSIPSVDTIYLGKGLTHNITPQRCSQTRGGGHAPVASRSPSSSTTIRRRKSSSCNERGRSVLAHVVTSDAEASYYFTNFEGLFSGKLVGVLTSLIGFSSAGRSDTGDDEKNLPPKPSDANCPHAPLYLVPFLVPKPMTIIFRSKKASLPYRTMYYRKQGRK